MISDTIPKSGRQLALLISALLLSGCDVQGPHSSGPNATFVRETQALLLDITESELSRTPELASRLGVPISSVGYNYAGALDDRSQAAFERSRLQRLETLERLEKRPVARLTPQLARDLAILDAALEDAVEMASFGHGQVSLAYARPFVADHLSGAYIDVQDILLFRQIVSNVEDVTAFLARFSAMADAIDDDRRRLKADASAGVIPPDFILERMAAQAIALQNLSRDGEHPIVETFERRLRAVSELDDAERLAFMTEAKRVFEDDVKPAYGRLIADLTELQALAPSEPGIWQVPEGDSYYAASLNLYNGKPMDPDDLHQEGVSIVASIEAALDAKLVESGFVDGSVGERLSALALEDGQIYPADEDGRTALLGRMRQLYDIGRDEILGVVPEPSDTAVSIAAVPEAFLASTPGAYYSAAPADGSSPAVFSINLQDTTHWPDFTLPALVFHETVPGHHLESSYPGETGGLSLIRQMIWPVEYGEGWALYAEDIAFELGLYDDILYAEIGYLQSLLFRAARIVADTGIHHHRWSRQAAIAYLVSVTGFSEASMEAEVDRYTVWPGQAASYMLGRNEILRLRNRAEEVLGSRFTLQKFHHSVLSGGPRPFDFVEADVDAWIAEELSR
ncbi:MAG: DUF885 domain-containing protein [Pseudomonadota bacterium]